MRYLLIMTALLAASPAVEAQDLQDALRNLQEGQVRAYNRLSPTEKASYDQRAQAAAQLHREAVQAARLKAMTPAQRRIAIHRMNRAAGKPAPKPAPKPAKKSTRLPAPPVPAWLRALASIG